MKLLLLILIVSLVSPDQANVHAKSYLASPAADHPIYLPFIVQPANLSQFTARLNLPYFTDDAAKHSNEAAITWFGKVSPSENYADLRVAFDNSKLWVYLSTFDHYLWYNTKPATSPLTDWDSATLQINMNGNVGSTPDVKTYRFDGAMSWFESRGAYQAAYRWQNSQWTAAPISFNTSPGYDGFFNDNTKGTRGWSLTFEIPFTSLGLSSRPSEGTIWGMSMTMHDRDSSAGPPLADKSWPVGMQPSVPSTWGQMRFGLPNNGALPGTVVGTTLIRRDDQRGIRVPDVALGGTTPNLCPGDENYIFNTWGNANFGSEHEFNIQNQANVADWPCFSKYYVTFPITTLPANKSILSARLILHQQGNAGDPGQATPSLIQVSTLNQDWSESTITWNNAPAPVENVSQSWADIPADYGKWPKVDRYWDVTAAVAQAYQAGQPVRLVLYEADKDQHSGKYFTSSDTDDWNIDGRPTLEIKWGN